MLFARQQPAAIVPAGEAIANLKAPFNDCAAFELVLQDPCFWTCVLRNPVHCPGRAEANKPHTQA